MQAKINPSILSADFVNLESELERISNADAVHVDVMDGHFVPNLTIGLPVVTRIAEVSPIPLDIHLMIEDADRWAPKYAELGVASVTFHYETALNPIQVAKNIGVSGAKPAMAIKPATSVQQIADIVESLDMVLVMTVEPGFGGQSFMEEQLEKVSYLRRYFPELDIQVDGGISKETIAKAASAGANVFVAGSAVYGSENPALEVELLRKLASVAL
ncbi:MAG: ribulose-phosphate 3-epimerase [Microbacteriaceae bacterium]|nr:ribulose-phosphate 3-epimerase [Microbacteriaceae bacterium]